MKNWNIILVASFTALLGLGAGYFWFGRSSAVGTSEPSEHQHGTEQVYTCSMHPQIRQNEPGKCPICGMDLIPVGDANAGAPLVLEMTAEAVKLADIQTVEVGPAKSGSPVKTVTLTGKIEADERKIASQVAHVPGRIEQLYVSFTGERVRKGQKLATIYSPEVLTAQRELLEARKWAATNPQLLEAARNKLRYWKIPDPLIEEVEQSGEVQPTITMVADQDGVVIKRRVAVGDYVKEGAVLLDLADLDRLWLLFDAYEEDLTNIRVGDQVEYAVPALPGRTFHARITFIDPLLNPQTRTVPLRAEVGNPNGLLKPEMFVRGVVRSAIGGRAPLLTVPKTAVMWTGPRSVVYVAVPGANVPSYEFREVTLGEAVGDQYLVQEGLFAGERVVVNGAFVIDAAAQLNNMASMMNRRVVQTGMAAPETPDHSEETPLSFKEQLGRLAEAYLPLKDALVGTDPGSAQKRAGEFRQALERVDMTQIGGAAHQYWMAQLNALRTHADQLAGSEEIEEQRTQFRFLSDALVQSLRAFGVAGHDWYVQHCPMAFDNQGGDWLSAEKTILNPYFGDKMLTCGLVVDSLVANK